MVARRLVFATHADLSLPQHPGRYKSAHRLGEPNAEPQTCFYRGAARHTTKGGGAVVQSQDRSIAHRATPRRHPVRSILQAVHQARYLALDERYKGKSSYGISHTCRHCRKLGEYGAQATGYFQSCAEVRTRPTSTKW